MGVGVQAGVGVAGEVGLRDGLSGSGDSAVGVALAVGVGREVQVGVGSRTGVTEAGSTGATGVSVIAGARDTFVPQQAVIPINNTTRPIKGRIRLILPRIRLLIVLLMPVEPSGSLLCLPQALPQLSQKTVQVQFVNRGYLSQSLKRSHGAADAGHPVIEKNRNGLGPASQDFVHGQVGLKLWLLHRRCPHL
jgi:hypothetical protein